MWRVFNKDGAEKKAPTTVVTPKVAVSNSITQVLATGGYRTLSWDTETLKTDAGMHSNGTNPSRLICTVAGTYHITASVPFAAGSPAEEIALGMAKNGAWVGGDDRSTVTYGLTMSQVITLAVGDYIEIVLYNGTGGSVTASAASYANMTKIDGAVVSYVGVPGSLVGQELAYAEVTANIGGIASTNVAGATAIVSASPITLDGLTKIEIEFFAPYIFNSVANNRVLFELFEDSTDLGAAGFNGSASAGAAASGGTVRRERTPPAGTHTYSVKAWVPDGGTGTLGAGAGGAATILPAFLRVKRAA